MTHTMTTLGLVLTLAATACASQPNVNVKDGHVFITTNDVVQNVTDLLSNTKALPLFKDQAAKLKAGLAELNETLGPRLGQVERRSTKNVVDLLQELTTTNAAALAASKASNSINAAALEATTAVGNATVALVTELKALKEVLVKQGQGDAGGGDDKSTGGQPWNIVIQEGTGFSDLGGDTVDVTFPMGRELISHPAFKGYHCQFTYVKSGKEDKTKFRVSAKAAALTPRLMQCATPRWGKEGAKITDLEASWTTKLTVFENGRAMPSPKNAKLLKWVPNTPKPVFPDTSKMTFTASKDKKKEFHVDFTLDYPYGPSGYSDVVTTFKSADKNKLVVTNLGVTGKSTEAARKLSFSITSSAKAATYQVIVTTTSKTTKLSTAVTVNIPFKLQMGLGEGGSGDVLTAAQMQALYQKLGVKDASQLKLCYSYALHGSSSSTMHSKCDGKGKLLLLMRRSKNNRVFGGYMHRSNQNSGGYYQIGNSGPAWLFNVNPSSKRVEYMAKCCRNYMYYYHPSHHLTWGGGHDLYCNNEMTSCYANIGHSYNSNGRGYHTTSAKSYVAGDYSWNHKSEGGSYKMVYEVYIVG